MYKIDANFRQTNNKNYYYIIAHTKKEAKDKFVSYTPWLKIYSVELCDKSEELRVINNPYKYICFNRKELKYD